MASESKSPPVKPPVKPASPPVKPATPPVTPTAAPPAPAPTPSPWQPPTAALTAFVGTRVVVTANGAIVEGNLIEDRDGCLVLTECRIVGRRHTAKCARLVFLKNARSISHINSLATEVRPVGEDDDEPWCKRDE